MEHILLKITFLIKSVRKVELLSYISTIIFQMIKIGIFSTWELSSRKIDNKGIVLYTKKYNSHF